MVEGRTWQFLSLGQELGNARIRCLDPGAPEVSTLQEWLGGENLGVVFAFSKGCRGSNRYSQTWGTGVGLWLGSLRCRILWLSVSGPDTAALEFKQHNGLLGSVALAVDPPLADLQVVPQMWLFGQTGRVEGLLSPDATHMGADGSESEVRIRLADLALGSLSSEVQRFLT